MTQAHTHEYATDVPRMHRGNSEPRITIALSAHGGGTVGQAYAGNGWSYSVIADGAELITGDDLRSAPARAAGHAEMTRTLANFLAAAGESLRYSGDDSEYAGEYNTAQRDFLTAEYERLSMFADNGA